MNLEFLKSYLKGGLTQCLNRNVENGYVDEEDMPDFMAALEQKISRLDNIKDEDIVFLLNNVKYIFSLSDLSDLVKYEMIISLPLLYDSFLDFKTFSLDYKIVVAAASFMVEPEDIYHFCKVFLNLEYQETLESTFSDLEDKVNFCGDVIQMVFDSKDYSFSKEEEERFLKWVLDILREKHDEQEKKPEEITNK